MPSGWNGFRARRVFRGVLYDIRVERRGQGNAVSLAVDGEPLAGDVVPHRPQRRRVMVEATVGS
jgi:cellobiose phosphorylase